jgi:hypothetical protein
MQKAIALTKNAPESGWRPRRQTNLRSLAFAFIPRLTKLGVPCPKRLRAATMLRCAPSRRPNRVVFWRRSCIDFSERHSPPIEVYGGADRLHPAEGRGGASFAGRDSDLGVSANGHRATSGAGLQAFDLS